MARPAQPRVKGTKRVPGTSSTTSPAEVDARVEGHDALLRRRYGLKRGSGPSHAEVETRIAGSSARLADRFAAKRDALARGT